MNLNKLESILSEQSGNKFCPICGTPYKPYHSRQKTCGSPECKKQYHAEYVKDYNRKFREENPYVARERSKLSMRKLRAKRKAIENHIDDLGKQLEYWEKREEFEKKITEYGDRYGEVSAQKTLEQVSKIDVAGGKDNDAVCNKDEP